MDRIINIDGKDIKFRATARTPRLYRMLVMRDLIKDMNTLTESYERVSKSKKKNQDSIDNLSVDDLTIFENVAYVMARHANPDMTEQTPDEWLDTFEMFSVWTVMPQLLELWHMNTYQTAESKKK